jgi:acyl-CoA synthetase (NDP forming)
MSVGGEVREAGVVASAADSALEALLTPKHIAIVGVSPTPTNVGRRLLDNLHRFEYQGQISLVNPRHTEIDGHACVPAITDLAALPDACVIATSAARALDAIAECTRVGVKGIVLYAGGFAELGDEGKRLLDRLAQMCVDRGAVLCGPNTLGNAALNARITTSFGAMWEHEQRRGGSISIVSQSGATLCSTYALGVARAGFSHLISSGNEAVVDLADYVDYLDRADENSRVFCVYYEQLRRPREFVRVCDRIVRAGKHVVALRGGRREAGSRAAFLHTGSVASDVAVTDYFLRESGVIFAESPRELAATATAIAAARGQRFGRRVGIVASSGGGAVVAGDAAEDAGLTVVPLAAGTESALREILDVENLADLANPLDISAAGFYKPGAVSDAAAAVDNDPDVDEVIGFCMAPASVSREFIEGLVDAMAGIRKPGVVICEQMLDDLGPVDGVVVAEGARDGFRTIARLCEALGTKETSVLPSAFETPTPDPGRVEPLDKARTGVVETEVYARCPWLETPPYRLVRDLDEAVEAAAELGFPLAMKPVANHIPHRAVLGVVRLNVDSEESVRTHYIDIMERLASKGVEDVDGILLQRMAPRGLEVIVGIREAPAMGDVIAIAFGGTGVNSQSLAGCSVLPMSEEDKTTLLEASARRLGLSPGDRDALAVGVDSAVRAWEEFGEDLGGLEFNPMILTPSGPVVVDALGS